MGRAEPSQGIAPQAHRKDIRAKLAKSIINKTIPAIISKNARAAAGVRESKLIVDPLGAGEVELKGGHKDGAEKKSHDDSHEIKRKRKSKGKGKRKEVDFEDHHESQISKDETTLKTKSIPTRLLKVRVMATDTLTAAHLVSCPSRASSKDLNPHSNVTLLNMASPLRPGGGVLSGATSQEEFLCARTTLLPSLHECFYRLPTLGGVLTRDVLVFRGSGPLDTPDLPAKERWWVDVVSAGMLRFPEVEEGRYVSAKDRETARRMIRALMRICRESGRNRVVLGAWGCGAFGNPVVEIATAWKEVLLEKEESWEPIEDVTFAITNIKMAEEFAERLGEGLEVEEVPGSRRNTGTGEREPVIDEDQDRENLRAKISEMEDRIDRVKVPELRSTLELVLSGMKRQLVDREGDIPNAPRKTLSIDERGVNDSLTLETDVEESYDERSDDDYHRSRSNHLGGLNTTNLIEK